MESVGNSIGEEVLEYGADVLLAPALNIHRNPLCGRNFEYYSEDPLVSGKIAAAYVKGIQSNGVGTSIKHYAVNNQETNRMKNDARVSPRALREIYLKGFEIAVKESEPWTVMSSYNYVNGVYTSESKDLQTTMLRDEWGFKGMVMTDWFGGQDAVAQMEAGNDMLQPGRAGQFEDIVNGVKEGRLSEKVLDRNVKRVLELILKSPHFKGYEYSNKPDLKAHAEVTRQSAVEGMVLLENKGVLPLTAEIRNVALFGTTSYDFIAGGTGSGNVNRAYTVSLLDGLSNAGYVADQTLAKRYLSYIEEETAKLNKATGDDPVAMFAPKQRPGEFIPDAKTLARSVAANDVAIITIGRTSGEFLDRKVADFSLSVNEYGLIKSVCDAFHAAGKKVVVLLNIGGVIETASWKNLPDAVLCAWQAGQEGGNSVTDVLRGVANPSGRLSMTFPVNYSDHASSKNFPVDLEFGMFGKEGGEAQRNVDYTEYEEGIYVGYRWFDKQNMEVSYPFGYGLSYTSFEYSNPVVNVGKTETTVSVDVKNTGAVAGKEVVQLYVAAPASKLDKPAKELKAFAKTGELKPGETQTVSLKLSNSDLASFDEAANAWVVEEGSYKFLVGSSSRDIRLSADANVKGSSRKVSAISFNK